MARATETTVYDAQTPGGRTMFETPDGLRFSPEQWQLRQFMDRLDKKLTRLIKLLEE